MPDINATVRLHCTLVSPGMGATLQTFFFISELMTELLPTLGYPMKPTLICFFSECSLPNCRSRLLAGHQKSARAGRGTG